MNQELLKETMSMFNLPEKWNAFLELYWQKDEIRNQWCSKLKEDATRIFSTEELVEGWEFHSWGLCDMQWYKKDHGENSIKLLFGYWFEMTLYCDGTFNDISKIHELLKTEKFAPLLSCFKRIDVLYDGSKLVIEKRNFVFNSPFDTKFDPDRLGWYAGNRTDEFIKQIAEKVNKFRKDETMNLLLDELNTLTKLNKE